MFVLKSTYDEANEAAEFWKAEYEKVAAKYDRCLQGIADYLSNQEAEEAHMSNYEIKSEPMPKSIGGAWVVYRKALRSAEHALEYKEKKHAEEVARLKKELQHAQNKISNQKKQIQSFEKQRSECAELHATVRELEGQLSDASKVTFAVAHHRNDALAVRRYTSHTGAVRAAHNAAADQYSSIGRVPFRIFALVGDTVIADVTDPDKWDETLPVSTKRPKGLTLEDIDRVMIRGY